MHQQPICFQQTARWRDPCWERPVDLVSLWNPILPQLHTERQSRLPTMRRQCTQQQSFTTERATMDHFSHCLRETPCWTNQSGLLAAPVRIDDWRKQVMRGDL